MGPRGRIGCPVKGRLGVNDSPPTIPGHSPSIGHGDTPPKQGVEITDYPSTTQGHRSTNCIGAPKGSGANDSPTTKLRHSLGIGHGYAPPKQRVEIIDYLSTTQGRKFTNCIVAPKGSGDNGSPPTIPGHSPGIDYDDAPPKQGVEITNYPSTRQEYDFSNYVGASKGSGINDSPPTTSGHSPDVVLGDTPSKKGVEINDYPSK
uniref:Uncharacterized protein LOC104220545 n=1 Tax=Nicotiana sylvestris TaxID=4096 RepID=A0A1U7VTQ4_NICSY|nr:PREDICTED: uncharacterized protein LOC104220545 [Nicotiana sylvestris]